MDRPFRWSPHHATQNHLHLGHRITTLHLDVDIDDREWQHLAMASRRFQAIKGRPATACLAGDNMVFCRGLVAGICPQSLEPEEEEKPETARASIARLPEELRPQRVLCMAAVSRDQADELVALIVRPDGWIQAFGRGQAAGTIDLAALRFAIDRGLSLVDEVRMHTCDFAGRRMVMLQGHLAERSFKVHSETRLGLLPRPCRPQAEVPFVVAGSKVGSFHLILVQPSRAYGVGGELTWGDSLWRFSDEVNLSGIVYPTTAESAKLSLGAEEWNSNRQIIILTEFQYHIKRSYGSMERAWHECFDTDGTGHINFTEFSGGCKLAGYVGNVGRVWALLDTEQSGKITVDELDIIVDEMDAQA